MTNLRGPLPFKVREADMYPQLDGGGITVRVDAQWTPVTVED